MKKFFLFFVVLQFIAVSMPLFANSDFSFKFRCRSTSWEGDSWISLSIDNSGNGVVAHSNNNSPSETIFYNKKEINVSKLSPQDFKEAFPTTQTYVGQLPNFSYAIVYEPKDLVYHQWVDFLDSTDISVFRLYYVGGTAMRCDE